MFSWFLLLSQIILSSQSNWKRLVCGYTYVKWDRERATEMSKTSLSIESDTRAQHSAVDGGSFERDQFWSVHRNKNISLKERLRSLKKKNTRRNKNEKTNNKIQWEKKPMKLHSSLLRTHALKFI